MAAHCEGAELSLARRTGVPQLDVDDPRLATVNIGDTLNSLRARTG